MRPLHLSLLVGSIVLAACRNEADLSGSPGATSTNASVVTDASAAVDADAAAGDAAPDAPDGATCGLPALAMDAAAADTNGGCVNVDISTYDRVCSSDADCRLVSSGMLCPGTCLCGNASINVDGLSRWQQAVASLPSADLNCNCPVHAGGAHCVQGMCTYEAQ